MKVKIKHDTRQFLNQAWTWNGRAKTIVTGEPLILACLLHTRGTGRESDDFKTVQELMQDINLEEDNNEE